jgi:Raf kinase inhibitor-like YbhB/YbcL family protein
MLRVVVAALAVLATLTAACGSGSLSSSAAPQPTSPGPSSAQPTSPSATAPTAQGSASMEVTMPASGSPTTTFALTSTAFPAGGAIPRKYSCDGEGMSVPLAWSGRPSGAVELALLVVDPDANGFVHWVAAGIPPTASGLREGASGSKDVPVEGRNGAGRSGWTGPCPPSGTHHYEFTLFALSKSLGLAPGVTAEELRSAVARATIATATLVGTYRRG